jgi:lysophospholipase L1-like esterase
MAAALALAACSSPTLPSKTTIIYPPALTCPAPQQATATSAQGSMVTFDTPVEIAGTAPVSVSCNPSSGSTFPIGTTNVTCTATDAVRRTASCSFSVSVGLPTPRLGVTTILAFGDSITEGEVPVAGEFRMRPLFVQPDQSYPADLVSLLAQRYSEQSATRVDAFCKNDPALPVTSGIIVINAGCLGEAASAADTLTRLNQKISAYHPNLLLLLEGVNDLDPESPASSIMAGVQGVRTLAATARSRGVPVLVGTLLPERAGLVNAGPVNLVVPFNNQLVPAMASVGAHVVDLYSDIVTGTADWISPYDGLHPTVAGYQEIARVWFAQIQSAYEVEPFSVRAVRPSSVRRR